MDGEHPIIPQRILPEQLVLFWRHQNAIQRMPDKDWFDCKHILVIRPDNMGDLLMSSPAIRALKETFGCKITVLTSSMGSSIAPYIAGIDDVIEFDLPWVKTHTAQSSETCCQIVETIKKRKFDAAVIFTVYSQNPLPSALLAYMAHIPLRLAYCRENPYALLTNWVPDKEPYTFIQHQVRRDLELVAAVGATTKDEHLRLCAYENDWLPVVQQLKQAGVDAAKPWLVLHAGVSEFKRTYPKEQWVAAAQKIITELGYQLILTGAGNEKLLAQELKNEIGNGAFSLAGLLSLPQFIALIAQAPLVLSVNTGTIHIAAAVGTPVVVLYALTNPQHSPWKAKGKVLVYDVPDGLRSKNEVIQYVQKQLHPQGVPMVMPDDIVKAIHKVLSGKSNILIPEMIALRTAIDQEL